MTHGPKHGEQLPSPDAALQAVEEGMGFRLLPEGVEDFQTGYSWAGEAFDPAKGVLENVMAAQRRYYQQADPYRPRQGGFVLGVLARVEELGGQQ